MMDLIIPEGDQKNPEGLSRGLWPRDSPEGFFGERERVVEDRIPSSTPDNYILCLEAVKNGNNYLYTLGADHQDPQLSAPVGIVIGAAVVISLLRDCHLEGEFGRGKGPVGRRSRVRSHHFLEETHTVE